VSNRPWLADRVIRPGDWVIEQVPEWGSTAGERKRRPVMVLDHVDINSSGPTRLVPLSCSSWDEERILIEADDDNMLSRNCSAVPAGMFSLDASDVIIRPPYGNVGEEALDAVMEVVDVQA